LPSRCPPRQPKRQAQSNVKVSSHEALAGVIAEQLGLQR
jgi:hypothetical protein